ncbi:MAG: DNA gyrase inhibitor YacG [Pseudomonadales bacterium]|nr:DNA gyrase inhibitor YacG [Pseudomonadales bacterium]
MSNSKKPSVSNATNNEPSARILPCPTCSKPAAWVTTNNARPFCSDRCKLIDLGAWSSGEHAIPGEPVIQFSESDEIDF